MFRFCYGVRGLVFVISVLSIINVIKVRPSAGWVRCFTFPYIPVTFLLCLKILQACNVFIIPCIYYPIPCIYSHGTGGGLI